MVDCPSRAWWLKFVYQISAESVMKKGALWSTILSTLRPPGAYCAEQNQGKGGGGRGGNWSGILKSSSPISSRRAARFERRRRTRAECALAKIMGAGPGCNRTGSLILRTALLSTVALGFLAGLTTSADASWRRTAYVGRGGWYGGYYGHHVRAASHSGYRASEPKKDVGFGDYPKGPLQLVVKSSTQKVSLYSNGVRVAQGPVSTGMPGHPTPHGVFSIIEKDRYHHSNLYSGAPMPYMQRITWSGVAIHEGVLPGHPASHGCIRTSHDFAQKLWPITKLGVRFIVARTEVMPADFS